MSDLHEVVFRWPYNAKEVLVTGTFDQWSSSVRLNKGPSGFTATVRVPWEERVLYKYIVDGKWTTIDQAPTEADWRGNINNIYHAPTKPQEIVTPRYEPPAAQEPKIAPVPAPVPVEERKENPVVEKKEPSPPAEVKVTPSVPKVAPVPVIPVNGTKPVNTPPSKTDKVAAPDNVPPTILPTPPNLKSPLPIIPVIGVSTAVKQPPVVEPPKYTDTPSTHARPINSPRKASSGTSSSNTLLTEKKEEEKKEPKPQVKQLNGTSNGIVKAEEPAKQPPSTPVKPKTTPTLPTTPTTPPTFSSPPTTPKKSYFPGSGSTSSSPSSSPGNTISRKGSLMKKRDSFINKVKHLFTPEKDKEHKGEKSHG